MTDKPTKTKGELLIFPAQGEKEMGIDQINEITRRHYIESHNLSDTTTLEQGSILASARDFENREPALKTHFQTKLIPALLLKGLTPEEIKLTIGEKRLGANLDWSEVNKLFDQLLSELREELGLPEEATLETVIKHPRADENAYLKAYDQITVLLGFPENTYEDIEHCLESGVEYDQKKWLIMAEKFDCPNELRQHLIRQLNTTSSRLNLDTKTSWSIVSRVIDKRIIEMQRHQTDLPVTATQKEVKLKITSQETRLIQDKVTDLFKFPRGSIGKLMGALSMGIYSET
jgi:hypothetical protein